MENGPDGIKGATGRPLLIVACRNELWNRRRQSRSITFIDFFLHTAELQRPGKLGSVSVDATLIMCSGGVPELPTSEKPLHPGFVLASFSSLQLQGVPRRASPLVKWWWPKMTCVDFYDGEVS